MADVRRSPFLTSTVLYDVNSTWNNSFDVSADPMEGFPYPSLYSWTRIILASVTVTVIMAATGLLLGNGLILHLQFLTLNPPKKGHPQVRFAQVSHPFC